MSSCVVKNCGAAAEPVNLSDGLDEYELRLRPERLGLAQRRRLLVHRVGRQGRACHHGPRPTPASATASRS